MHRITSEKLAYWYFRLNGFLTMENFILHHALAGLPQRTDADICGVRFPFREELNVQDDDLFRRQPEKPFFVIAEIKSGECMLNGPWTNPLKQNMQYVLKAIGALKPSLIEVAADALYGNYVYEDEKSRIQLIAIGSRTNEEYKRDRPNLRQLLFIDMLNFIYNRLHEFRMQKRDHKQWDTAGRFLYESAEEGKDKFVSRVFQEANLTMAQTRM